MVDIRVPTLGESVTEATVATWFKKVGDAVKVDEMLCELETDKVTVEVPATAAGVLAEIVAKDGETVGVDALLAAIDERPRKPPRPPAKPAAAAAPAEQARGQGRASAAPDRRRIRAGERAAPIEIMVPTLGESVTEATVSTWFKKPATPSPRTRCSASSRPTRSPSRCPPPPPARWPRSSPMTAPPWTPAASSAASPAEPAAPPAAAPVAAAGAAAARSAPAPAAQRDVENAPSANKLMADRGLSPDQVEGTGRDGRVMKEDVLRAEAAGPRSPRPRPPPRRSPSRSRARRSPPRTPPARSG